MRKEGNLLLLTTSAAILVSAVLLAPAMSRADDSLNLTVSPPILEMNVQPGQSVDESLDVTNAAKTAVTLYPLARDFEASADETSSSPQILEQAVPNSSTIVSPWIKFSSDTLSIPAGRTASLKYSISVPADASPGGHYGGVFVSTQQPTSTTSSNVGIETRVGSLLMLTVSGQTKVAANAVEFLTQDSKGHTTALFQSMPIQFKATIQDTGNVHLQPIGNITIKNMFGKQVLQQAFNETGSRILPSSSHSYLEKVTDQIGWGRFEAKAILQLKAPDGNVLPMTMTTVFWVLPILPIVIGLIVLIALIIGFKLWLSSHDKRVKTEPKQK